ncbi:MAG: zf-HC2 domain-containing protein [Actinomycetota bacterium]
MSGIDCERALRALERYLDGEAPATEAALVAEHLADCVPCAGRQDFLQNLRRVIREKCGTADLPPELESRIRGVLFDFDASL